jgi:hypothetical protein
MRAQRTREDAAMNPVAGAAFAGDEEQVGRPEAHERPPATWRPAVRALLQNGTENERPRATDIGRPEGLDRCTEFEAE